MSPENTTLATSVVTVAASDLRRILRDVLPFTARSDDYPALQDVCLETDGRGVLSATATDRFTLGHSRTDCSGAFGRRMSISGTNARLLAKLTRTGAEPFPGPAVTITPQQGTMRVDCPDAGKTGPASWSLTLPLSEHEFANYAGVLAKADADADTGPAIGLNPHLLARFRKIARDWPAPMQVYARNSLSPVVVQIGDSFLGIIMPVRLDTGDGWPAGPTVPLGHDPSLGGA